jgi:hypothetical protein
MAKPDDGRFSNRALTPRTFLRSTGLQFGLATENRPNRSWIASPHLVRTTASGTCTTGSRIANLAFPKLEDRCFWKWLDCRNWRIAAHRSSTAGQKRTAVTTRNFIAPLLNPHVGSVKYLCKGAQWAGPCLSLRRNTQLANKMDITRISFSYGYAPGFIGCGTALVLC